MGSGERHKSFLGLMTSNICVEMEFESVEMIKCTNCETNVQNGRVETAASTSRAIPPGCRL